jgi:hypothetical protein
MTCRRSPRPELLIAHRQEQRPEPLLGIGHAHNANGAFDLGKIAIQRTHPPKVRRSVASLVTHWFGSPGATRAVIWAVEQGAVAMLSGREAIVVSRDSTCTEPGRESSGSRQQSADAHRLGSARGQAPTAGDCFPC